MLLDKLFRNALDRRDKSIYLSSSLSLPHHPLLWLTQGWHGSVTGNIVSINMWLITWKCKRPYFMNTFLCTSFLSFGRQWCLSHNAKILKVVKKWSGPQFAALLILKQFSTTVGMACPAVQGNRCRQWKRQRWFCRALWVYWWELKQMPREVVWISAFTA